MPCANASAGSPVKLGRPLKMLVGKPGLDGHSNGAEQIAVKARDVGIEVVYDGIRLTPEEIVQSARDEGVHVVGLSILSGSHGRARGRRGEGARAGRPRRRARRRRRHHPRRGRARGWKPAGVKRVYTPKDFDLTAIMNDVVDVVAASANA